MQKKLESHTARSQAAGKACKTYQLKLEGQLTKVTEEVIWPRIGGNGNRSNNCPIPNSQTIWYTELLKSIKYTKYILQNIPSSRICLKLN